MQGKWKDAGRAAAAPLVAGLDRLGLTANGLTGAGLALAAVAGILAGLGYLRPSAICLILSSLCDLLDGQLARRRGQTSLFGAFFDSNSDRLAEGAIFLGLIVHYGPDSPGMVVVTGLALIGSYMVSYARARAEGLHVACQVGLMERPERLIVLVAALLLGGRVLAIGLASLAALAIVTFVQRVRHVRRTAGQPAANAAPRAS